MLSYAGIGITESPLWTVSAGISIDKMRLLSDQSTENIALGAIIEKLDREKRERIKREEKAEKTDG
jgi:hypothetical protein